MEWLLTSKDNLIYIILPCNWKCNCQEKKIRFILKLTWDAIEK